MKALILCDTAVSFVSIKWQGARAQLSALGIQFDFCNVDFAPSAANISSTYDFVIIPRITGNKHKALIDSASLTVPVFVMDTTSLAAFSDISATAGASGGPSATDVDEFIEGPFTTSRYCAVFSKFATLTTGTSLMASQATSPLTDSAQTNSGKSCLWRTSKAGGKGLYISTIASDIQPLLPFLLQHAYNAGDFTSEQMSSLQRLPVTIDQDHVIGSNWYQDVTLFDRWYSLLPSTAVVWCGINNLADITGMSAEVQSRLQAGRAAGKLKLCYHSHDSGTEKITGTWPTQTSSGVSMATEVANYEAFQAALQAKGLDFDDPFYHVPATNMWDEETIRFTSAYGGIAADPANTTETLGKGCVAVRTASSNQCSRPFKSVSAYPTAIYRTREFARGITIVPSVDMALESTGKTIAQWRTLWTNYFLSIAYGQSLYVHDEDFIDPQNAKTGEMGEEIFAQLLDLKTYLANVADFFANPVNYSLQPNWA